MAPIELKTDSTGKGAFVIEENGKRLAEMSISITGENITVFHTEVVEEMRGKGIAAQLLAAMVDYARSNKLKVIPLCPYTYGQFKRKRELYNDIWNKSWHGK